MMKLLSNARMRQADRAAVESGGVTGEELMRRAGEGIAREMEAVLQKNPQAQVCVVCGNGNNGGDGYVCARILRERGYKVSVYALDGGCSPDCLREKERYGGSYTDRIGGDVVVDCIFGTGLSRGVAGEYLHAIRAINGSGAYVVAADIPSGLNGDNGKRMGEAVKADLTVAVAEYKLGHFFGDGPDCCGRLVKIDIGIGTDGDCAALCGEEDIRPLYPARRRNSHKGTYGCAQLIAGSERYRGAAVLASAAALRSGCGYVKLSSCGEVKTAVASALPQVIHSVGADLSAQAIAVGMGCGVSEELYERVTFLLGNYRGKLVIDADGLNVLAKYGADVLKDRRCDVLITPHVGEFSRLTGLTAEEITEDPVSCARRFAEEYGVTVLLKNAVSVVADGKGVLVNAAGSTALAKGGSGDILSGLICGNAARGLSLAEAAIASCYVLGKTAELCSEKYGDYCTTAEELLKNLPMIVKSLTT